MKAIEGAIYCKDCVAKLTRRNPRNLALKFPASRDKWVWGICRGCEKEVRYREASKVVKRKNYEQKAA